MVVNVFSQALYVQNRQRFVLIVRVVGLALKLALSLLLLPRVGVVGAALASVLAEGLVLLVFAGDFRLDLPHLLPRLARLGAVCIATVLAMLALGGIHPILGMIGGALVYAGGVGLGRVLANDDWDLLYRLLAAVPGGSLVLRYWHREVELNW
jgi:O-antigen/teichoic acid export membrane protein